MNNIVLWQEKQKLQESLAALEEELNARFGGDPSNKSSPKAPLLDLETKMDKMQNEEHIAPSHVSGTSEAKPIHMQNFQFGG